MHLWHYQHYLLEYNQKKKAKKDKCLKYLLIIHGIFFISCFVMPILGIFKTNMNGEEIIGVIILEFWCIYFMPICILSYKYFKNK
jgi:isoprenylcysteine carboxyl methyltransferase (ICMT) family protein YpbQ